MDQGFKDLQIGSKNQPISPFTDDCKTDLISSIPEEILIRIISFLPAKCMVATSLVSRRWRYLWTFSTRINFKSDLDSRDRTTPEVIITRLFEGHNESIMLNFCRISICDIWNPNLMDIHRWISFLTKKCITKLRLEWLAFEDNPYEILSIPTLQELFLGSFYDFCGVQPRSNSCVALRSLFLKSSNLTDMDLNTLINNAPHLERLSLSSCFSLDHALIRSPVLKRLEIERILLASLTIDTPVLNTLLLTYLDGLRKIKINAPSLFLLNISNITEENEIIDRSDFPLQSQSENFILMNLILDCPNKVAKFRNLQKIYVQIKLDGEMCVYLAPVLRNCHYLRELGIVNKGVGTLGSKSTYWKQKQEETFFCLENHMEYLWIEGFKWHKNENDFIDFILSKALLLKKLVIWHDLNVNGNTDLIMTKASSNLKVSIQAEIV